MLRRIITPLRKKNSRLILKAKQRKFLSGTYLAEVVGDDPAAEGAQLLRHGADV